MKRKKLSPLLACLMIIAMFCTMFPVTAFAGEATMATVGNATAQPGQDVTIPITISNHPDIEFADLYLHYDMSALTLKKFTTSPSIFSDYSQGAVPSQGWYNVALGDFENIVAPTGTDITISMTFTVNGNAQLGDYPITFNASSSLYSDLEGSPDKTINTTYTPGQITVAETPAAYTVTTDSGISGGSIVVSPTSGSAGSTVNVTVTPDNGKQLVAGSLKYSADDGSTYTAITATEGVYSFALPAANVIVTAQFETPPVGLATVYLDGATGLDTNDGTSAVTAVKTFAQAKALLAKDGIIYITGQVDVIGTEYWTLKDYGSAMVKRGSGYTGDMICADWVTDDPSNLTLENITIDGGYQKGNANSITAEGSIILEYGNLTMGDGAVLQNNYVSIDPGYYYGGAVSSGYGTFTMDGGVIQNNYTTCFGGGAVSVGYGTFIMNGGEINNNTATAYSGGGVYVGDSSTFTMNGGTISGNTATNTAKGSGGGVYVSALSYFTMNDGTISQNTATNGGGLYNGNISNTEYSGDVAINGGTISNNSATVSGGGIYQNMASSGGSLTMTNGTVSGNTAGDRGNGIYTEGSKITLSPAAPGTFNIADNIYHNGGSYLNLGATLAGISSPLIVRTTTPQANSVVAEGAGGYTPTAADTAEFVYSTYDWDFALSGNKIVLTESPVNNILSVDHSSLTFDLAAEGYSASDIPAKTVTVSNTGADTITLNQPLGGDSFTIGALSKTTLAAGETATFTVIPKTGLAAGSYSGTILISTTNNDKVKVNGAFSVGYSITVTQPAEGGTITVDTHQFDAVTVNPNLILIKKDVSGGPDYNVTFTFTPSTGYKLVDALINGVSRNWSDPDTAWSLSYPSETISGNFTCSATFAPATYIITASVYNNEGGTITPGGETSVTGQQNQTYTFTPDTSYHVSAVYVDNTAVDLSTYADNTYTFNPVAANHTIVVAFEVNQCTVVFNKNANEATGAMDDQSFTYGDEGTLTENAFSRTGYTFAGWAITAGGAKAYDDQAQIQNLAAENNGTITLYAVWTAVAQPMPGDINGDNAVNILDVVQTVNFSLGSTTPTTEQFIAADGNQDGSINILDVVLIVNKSLMN